MADYTSSAQTEAIRIAVSWLPRSTRRRQLALAEEILRAIELCEAEVFEVAGQKAMYFGPRCRCVVTS